MRMYSIGQTAKQLGVSVDTLQRWDKSGKLAAHRSSTNQRYYTEDQIASAQGVHIAVPSRVIAYCRVSSAAQKPDLKNQRRVLEEFSVARGIANAEFVEEVGEGLNFKRKLFLDIMDSVDRREIKTLILAHKDRLVRFGFTWFERYCISHGCELLILNQEQLSPEQEMVQDLMTIVHCFSSRLYGLRNYRKKLQEAINAPSAQDKTESND